MHINREKAKTGTKWAAGVGGWATAAVLALKMGLSGPAPLPPEQVAQQPQERPVAVRVLSADEAASTLTLKFPGPEELDRVKDGAPITFEPVAAADAAPPVPEPVPAPGPAPDAAAPVAPDAAGAGPKPILGEVDGMLGDGPGPQFFDNVDGAVTKLKDGLKADPELAKDPQFWVRLAMTLSSTGQKGPGDWEVLTDQQKQDKKDALGAFNTAYELDPGVNNQRYGPAGATVADAYRGTRDKMGVKPGEAAALRLTADDAGNLTLGTKTE